jgi:hypothetical protein
MNFDLEGRVLETATQLFELAGDESLESEETYRTACNDIVRQLLERHPDLPLYLITWAASRALGRCEGQLRERQRQRK